MTQEAKHTPGPWHVTDQVEGNYLGIFGEDQYRQPSQVQANKVGACICLVSPLAAVTETDEANAQLIASAPELLIALEQAEIWLTAALGCKEWPWDGDQWDAATGSRDYALEIITKAKGQKL